MAELKAGDVVRVATNPFHCDTMYNPRYPKVGDAGIVEHIYYIPPGRPWTYCNVNFHVLGSYCVFSDTLEVIGHIEASS